MFPFFVHCSSFVPLPVRLAPSFVRHLFVICSFIVRSLFVFCSSFVRLLFVHCSSFVRSLFVLCSFFVRSLFVFSLSACAVCTVICSSFLRPTFPLLHSLSLGEGWGEDIFFICLSCYDCLCGSHLPVWLTPLTLHFLLNCFPILIKILHRDFFPVKANIFKLFCYLTTFAYNDDSEVF